MEGRGWYDIFSMGLGKFERYDGKLWSIGVPTHVGTHTLSRWTCLWSTWTCIRSQVKLHPLYIYVVVATTIYTVFNSSCLSRRCMPLAGFKRKRWSICTHFVSWLLVAWESQAWLELKAGISIKRQLGVHRGTVPLKEGIRILKHWKISVLGEVFGKWWTVFFPE